jgi:hypothetical protein
MVDIHVYIFKTAELDRLSLVGRKEAYWLKKTRDEITLALDFRVRGCSIHMVVI